MAALLYGVKPIIIAIVVQALWGLGRTAVKSRMLAVLAAPALLASFAGLNALAILVGVGLLTMVATVPPKPGKGAVQGLLSPGISLLGPASVTGAGMAAPVGLA